MCDTVRTPSRAKGRPVSMQCVKCGRLSGAASSIEPHAELRRIEIERFWTGSMRRVGADLYRCKDCSTTWVRHKSASAYSLAGWHAR